jgi:enterochelin esterase-like enzyme
MTNFWQKPVETLQELLRRKAPHLRQIRHFQSFALEREVELDVYLPPDYHLSPGKYYPLVLFNDGQDLPRMGFARTLERLFFKKQIPHLIAVGVYASEERMREYGTAQQPDYKGRGDKAGLYRDFILQELLPFVQRRFRISGLTAETAFAGFSLGGLSALDMALAYPQIFGTVGVFSGSLWWRSVPVDPTDPDADRIVHDLVRISLQVNENQRFWFQCGTLDEEDDRNGNGVIDSIDDTLDLIRELKNKGVQEENIRYLEVKDGRHEPATWGEAMPDFLRWAFVRALGQ